jgi:hypothetical protein
MILNEKANTVELNKDFIKFEDFLNSNWNEFFQLFNEKKNSKMKS